MGTIGEFVKTKAAQAEADSHIRKTLNFWLKGDTRRKVLKYEKGRKGTLNYGRYVIIIETAPDSMLKKINPKAKPSFTLLWGDFGILARATLSSKNQNQHWKFYRQKVSAEKEFKSQVRMMNY